jgi:hypothetical protein
VLAARGEAVHATPRRMHPLLAEYAWGWKAAPAALRQFITDRLSDLEAIVVLDETAELKKRTETVGIARRHAGITGQVGNCQTVVFAAYVTARPHALSDFRLYLQKHWCRGRERQEQKHTFRTIRSSRLSRPGHAERSPTRASRSSGVAPDEVYGLSSKLREIREEADKGVRAGGLGEPPVHAAVVRRKCQLPPWAPCEIRSPARGRKGSRDKDRSWAETSPPRHWRLIRRRRSVSTLAELAFFYGHAQEGRRVSLPVPIRIARKIRPMEESFQQGNRMPYLDQR